MQIKSKNIPENKQAALRKWLDDSAFSTLREVLESVAGENEAKAANAMLQSTAGMDSEAKEFTRIANLHHEIIDVLMKLRESKNHFTIVEIKICPKSQSTND